MNDVFGTTFHGFTIEDKENQSKNVKIVELWLKDEEIFLPGFTSKLHPDIENILKMRSAKAGAITGTIAISTETYQKAGTGNGAKGMSRIVLVNENGQRILDAQIKVTNAA